ncbi:MAG: hypothetical protein DRI86_06855 [Bacteroidetes bacterium]|nr:MAG: hypothetical protein DRI86_06855 [Bacteroidota bacterium]
MPDSVLALGLLFSLISNTISSCIWEFVLHIAFFSSSFVHEYSKVVKIINEIKERLNKLN